MGCLTSIRTNSEIAFMWWVWQEWEYSEKWVECLECGKYLWFAPIHVAHILGKGTEPYLRLVKENVIPLCAGCHKIFDTDLRSEMMIGPWVINKQYELRNKAKNREAIEYKRIKSFNQEIMQELIRGQAGKYIGEEGYAEHERQRIESHRAAKDIGGSQDPSSYIIGGDAMIQNV